MLQEKLANGADRTSNALLTPVCPAGLFTFNVASDQPRPSSLGPSNFPRRT